MIPDGCRSQSGQPHVDPATRRRHSREHLRYASDVSDEEWALLEAALAGAVPDGTAESVADEGDRERDLLRAPIRLRLAALPDSFPPRQTVYGWFLRLRDDCVLERLNHHLVMLDRARSGRAASPSAGVLDSQSVKTTVGRRAEGLRRRQEDQGQKRHALVDTDGRPLVLEPHPADIQDRDGGGPVLAASRHAFPFDREGLRRQRLRREAGCRRHRHRRRDRSQEPRPDRLRRPAPALGRRALLRLDRPQPPPRQGLRRQPSNPPEPSSTPPPSCCSPAGSRNQDEFRVGL